MKGTEVQLIDLEDNGLPKISSLEKLLSADDSMKLVSLMHINNEIGNIIDLHLMAILLNLMVPYFILTQFRESVILITI